ncbi:MAG: LCP family protein [Thermoleophilia bacterium]|nr:LCP family protein [Thermoleophilia bacterium]
MVFLFRSGRHYKKKSTWKRILKWTVLSLLAAGLVVGLAGFIFVYHTLGKIGEDTAVIYEARQQLDVPLPDEPKNILVMGTDSDPDGDGRRSDTILLVRVNPDGERLSLLSIPRDTIVDIPGAGQDKINAAYAIGGVPLAIDTVRDLTDLPIHHFVVIDYLGFEEAVDALGGVYVDVDRRYFNDNSDAPWGEAYEPIDIFPGYQRLNGADALAYVRFRHTDSDFVRIARQQYFIRDAKSQSLEWSNVTRIIELADVFASNSTSDIGRNDILSLTKFILSVEKDNIYQAQLPVKEVADEPLGNYIWPDSEKLEQVLNKFIDPAFEPPEPAVPEAEAPDELGLPSQAARKLVIEVLNGSGKDGAAATAAELLKQKGCLDVTVGGDANNTYPENQIYFETGAQAAAEELCSLMKPCDSAPLTDEMDTSAQLLVVMGESFEGLLTEEQPETGTSLNFEDNSDASWAEWKASALKVPFQLQKPGSFPEEFDYVDFHTYEIETDDGPRPALKIVCEDEAGNNWGIMETTYTDAPLLKSPTVEREIEGRNYKFFYAGKNLRYIAWQDGEAVVWITNSLQNSLSEEVMIRLATSFQPV